MIPSPFTADPSLPRYAVRGQVRFASHHDLDCLVGAYEWLFAAPGTPAPNWDPVAARARLADACAAADRAVFVFGQPQAITGFCTVYLDMLSVRHGQRAWVEDLAVAPDERSKGTGSALLTMAMRWARTHGATHMQLDSALGRHDAHRFYERHSPTMRTACFGWDFTNAAAEAGREGTSW